MTGLSISGGESMTSRTVLAEQGRGGSGPTYEVDHLPSGEATSAYTSHTRPREGHARGSQFKLNGSHF